MIMFLKEGCEGKEGHGQESRAVLSTCVLFSGTCIIIHTGDPYKKGSS